jgi:hypothetical protein
MHIQQAKLEIGGGAYQPMGSSWRKLELNQQEEVTEDNLSEEKLSSNSVMRLQN